MILGTQKETNKPWIIHSWQSREVQVELTYKKHTYNTLFSHAYRK
jgi:hypothetical protein